MEVDKEPLNGEPHPLLSQYIRITRKIKVANKSNRNITLSLHIYQLHCSIYKYKSQSTFFLDQFSKYFKSRSYLNLGTLTHGTK